MSRRAAGIDDHGWLAGARRVESPNHDARPAGAVVDLLVVHHVSLPPGRFSGDAVERFFTNALDPAAHPYYAGIAHLRVSAHFLVRRRGELIQFVSCDARAWHAGASCFMGRERCNDFSIGVELEGTGDVPYTDAQYRVLARLARVLSARYPMRWVAGHEDIAPGRKTDPGPSFDWPRALRALAPARLSRPFAPRTHDGAGTAD